MDLREVMRAADPVGREPDLDANDAQNIRRAVVTSIDRAAAPASSWPRPLMLAATFAMTIATVVLLRNHAPREKDAVIASRQAVPSDLVMPSSERRQLQFSSPGGTRIIWVFDPEFHP